MQVRNATQEQLQQALSIVNTRYSGNIRFKRIDRDPSCKSGLVFTLTVVSSRGPGSRISSYSIGSESRRRIAAACWHVHGHFFDALFSIAPGAKIKSSRYGHTGWITIDQGNWKDSNVGSQAYPALYSKLCDCAE